MSKQFSINVRQPKVKKAKEAKPEKYFEAVGRRKTAVARVRLYRRTKPGEPSELTINKRTLALYFALKRLQDVVKAPFDAISTGFIASIKVQGGGSKAQAEAIRLGIARALTLVNPKWRPRLKSEGYLFRDPRQVERKKPGLRKARRPQQWRKR